MAQKSKKTQFNRIYLREWRQAAGLKQAEVLAKLDEIEGDLPRTGASLSRLENGKQPYSQAILEALADIYGTEPGSLISKPPETDEVDSMTHEAGELIDMFVRLPLTERKRLIAVAEVVFGTDAIGESK